MFIIKTYYTYGESVAGTIIKYRVEFGTNNTPLATKKLLLNPYHPDYESSHSYMSGEMTYILVNIYVTFCYIFSNVLNFNPPLFNNLTTLVKFLFIIRGI